MARINNFAPSAVGPDAFAFLSYQRRSPLGMQFTTANGLDWGGPVLLSLGYGATGATLTARNR